MVRPLRIERANAWYHITARGNERRAIFMDDQDRQRFLALLAAWVERFRLRLYAYVLMENHYHLLVETVEVNLSDSMQWLNVSYSIWFNRRHHRVGHLFQGRFQGILIDERQWGLQLTRYLHLNPIRRKAYQLDKASRQRNRAGVGEVRGPEHYRERMNALREYSWSSYRAYIGLAQAPDWLSCDEMIHRLPGNLGTKQKGYRQYMEEALLEGVSAPWSHLQGQMILGDQQFVEGLREGLRGNQREQPALRQLMRRSSWEEIVRVVEGIKQERWGDFRDRRGDWGRDVALYLGRKCGGLKLKQLGAIAGVDYASVVMALRRLEQRRQRDVALAQFLRQAESFLLYV